MKEKIDADDLCTLLGGDFDFETKQCTFTMPGEHDKPTIFDRTTLVFFILQVIIGCATTVFAVYYNPIAVPASWWVQYIVLAVSFAIALAMYWIKTTDINEATARALLSMVTIAAFSIAMGCLIHWDILAYASLESFAGEPVTATVTGIIVAALLSFVITTPEERTEASKGKRAAATFPFYG